MKKRISALHRTLLTTGVAVGLGLSLSQTALADTASADLEIHAGLRQSLTLICNPLSFGVTTMNLMGIRGDVSRVVLNPSDSSLTIGTGNDQIALATTDVQAGQCLISGSRAANEQEVTIELNGVALGDASTQLSVGGSSFLSLSAPTTPETLTVNEFTTDVDTVRIQSGGAMFFIGGTLVIPATIVAANLGGYSAEVTITVDDDPT